MLEQVSQHIAMSPVAAIAVVLGLGLFFTLWIICRAGRLVNHPRGYRAFRFAMAVAALIAAAGLLPFPGWLVPVCVLLIFVAGRNAYIAAKVEIM